MHLDVGVAVLRGLLILALSLVDHVHVCWSAMHRVFPGVVKGLILSLNEVVIDGVFLHAQQVFVWGWTLLNFGQFSDKGSIWVLLLPQTQHFEFLPHRRIVS